MTEIINNLCQVHSLRQIWYMEVLACLHNSVRDLLSCKDEYGQVFFDKEVQVYRSPSGLSIGTILNTTFALRARARRDPPVRKSITPWMINCEGVSPGCTLGLMARHRQATEHAHFG